GRATGGARGLHRRDRPQSAEGARAAHARPGGTARPPRHRRTVQRALTGATYSLYPASSRRASFINSRARAMTPIESPMSSTHSIVAAVARSLARRVARILMPLPALAILALPLAAQQPVTV